MYVRTILSETEFLGCIDNRIFLPMVLRYDGVQKLQSYRKKNIPFQDPRFDTQVLARFRVPPRPTITRLLKSLVTWPLMRPGYLRPSSHYASVFLQQTRKVTLYFCGQKVYLTTSKRVLQSSKAELPNTFEDSTRTEV